MSELPAATMPEPKRRRGEYSVSPRLQRALQTYADGSATTQQQAADAGGLSLRAFQRALTRQNVRSYIEATVRQTLTTAAPRAARRMAELLTSPNEMVGFRASQFVLATGAGVVAPNANSPGVNINISNTVTPGYVLDLRSNADRDLPLSAADQAALSPVGGVLVDRPGPALIEHEAGPRRDDQ